MLFYKHSMLPKAFRSGFSLIEALVVLAIGGMALAIIFSIGVKAGDTGFGLGRRALAAADADVAASDVRAIIRSFALRPSSTFLAGIDRPVSGDASRLEGDVVMERATQCAPQGWAGRLVLEIANSGPDRVLSCSAGGKTAVLIRLGQTAARFSYSEDGQAWNSVYSNLPPNLRDPGELRSRTLWVRFDAAPLTDVVEMASSGRPELWVRPDADF